MTMSVEPNLNLEVESEEEEEDPYFVDEDEEVRKCVSVCAYTCAAWPRGHVHVNKTPRRDVWYNFSQQFRPNLTEVFSL